MQRNHGEDFVSGGEGGADTPYSPSAPSTAERVEVTVELDADVVAKIKALGPNWQEKVNAILKMAKI
jgi:uncharacterized protein (DUF4415 family)